MGEDINKLKTSVRAELSRGIANGSSWNEMAAKMAMSFKNTPFNKAYNNSIRIARTEGHRIQNQSALDAQHKAKSKGADVVKQWDSTLDGATRDTHRLLDGQIREIDEPFEVGGRKADAPGMFGDPAEDCNCRCCLLQRARWALDDKELEVLREKAAYHGLLVDDSKKYGHEKAKDFADFKEKYLKASQQESVNVQKSSKGTSQEKALEKNDKSSIIKLDLQFFAEKDIKNQESSSLIRAIRKYNTKIDEHTDKINNPEKHIDNWDKLDPRQQEGLKRHWNKEIRNFNQSITDRIDELKERGDYHE